MHKSKIIYKSINMKLHIILLKGVFLLFICQANIRYVPPLIKKT